MSEKKVDTHAEDIEAIERFHEQDIKATLAGDPAAVAELWTDDIVLLSPGQDAQIGKQSILAARQRQIAAQPGFRVLSYVPEIKGTTVTADGWAFQWGVMTGTYVAAKGTTQTQLRMKLLRVLKKQPDGSWKAAIGMTN